MRQRNLNQVLTTMLILEKTKKTQLVNLSVLFGNMFGGCPENWDQVCAVMLIWKRFFEPSIFNFLTMDNESPIYWGMLAKCDSCLKR